MPGVPRRLRCEYLDNPLGIDARSPRLAWWLDDKRPAELQTAYHILAASRRDLLDLDEGDLWDSGVVESQQCSQVPYRGKRLLSGRQVWWKVRTFDSDGLPSAWSEAAAFEAGLDSSEWRARWIATPLTGSRASPAPVPAVRRVFELATAPRAARLYVAALGLHRVEINGARVGEDELAPGWSRFEREVDYQTYDVTGLLAAGPNCLAALLADGWYAGRIGIGERQHYGPRPELRAELHITLESGGRLIISTDGQWQWRPSWIVASDLVDGESVDWRQYDPAWSSAESTADWYPVAVIERSIAMVGKRSEAVRVAERMTATPLAPREAGGGRRLYALPFAVLGRAVVRARLPEGALLRVRYGLGLDRDGRLVDAVSEDVHTAAGADPGESLSASFVLHGFRYLEVSGDLFGEEPLEVEVESLRRGCQPSASFICDHPELNRRFAELSAHLEQMAQSVPLAGLTPSARLPLLEVSGARARSALLSQGDAAGLGRWLNVVCASQLEDGGFPEMVPAPPDIDDLLIDGDPPAGDSVLECAWQMFRLLGDRRALEGCYPSVKRFISGLKKRHPDHLRGDDTADLEATVWYYRSVRTASRIAGVLGNLVDLEDYEMLAGAIRQAFRRHFVTPDGRLSGDDLPGYLAALSHGLLDAPERRSAIETFLRRLEAQRRSGANLVLPDLLRTLTLLGRADLALELLLERDASSVAELEEQQRAGVIDWLLTSLAGMDLGRDLSDASNAFKRMRIQPRPPLGGFPVGDLASAGPPLRSVEAALATVHGRYEVCWQITDDAFELAVLVPANCGADVIMPDDTLHEVMAGRHEFVMPYQRSGDGIPVLREVSTAS